MKDCSAALARPWLELPFLDTRGGAEGRKEHWHLSPWAVTDVQPEWLPSRLISYCQNVTAAILRRLRRVPRVGLERDTLV